MTKDVNRFGRIVNPFVVSPEREREFFRERFGVRSQPYGSQPDPG